MHRVELSSATERKRCARVVLTARKGSEAVSFYVWDFCLIHNFMSLRLQDEPTSSTYVPGPYDDASRILSQLPPPRPVRLSFRGKSLFCSIVGGGLAAVALIAVEEHYYPAGLTLRAGLDTLSVVVIVSSVVMLLIYSRQKRLISDGDFVIGRLTKLVGSSRMGTYLRYEFEAKTGERLSDIAWYGSPILSVGMRLPVFYDRDNPDKKVAVCASFYEVVLTGRSRKALA
jgi:hypothetical protein